MLRFENVLQQKVTNKIVIKKIRFKFCMLGHIKAILSDETLKFVL